MEKPSMREVWIFTGATQYTNWGTILSVCILEAKQCYNREMCCP